MSVFDDGKNSFRAYLLVADTNLLRANPETPSVVLSQLFSARWKEISSADDVALVIPEVVFGELAYQRAANLLQKLERTTEELKTVYEFLSEAPPQFLDEEAIIKRVREELERELSTARNLHRREDAPWKHKLESAHRSCDMASSAIRKGRKDREGVP